MFVVLEHDFAFTLYEFKMLHDEIGYLRKRKMKGKNHAVIVMCSLALSICLINTVISWLKQIDEQKECLDDYEELKLLEEKKLANKTKQPTVKMLTI